MLVHGVCEHCGRYGNLVPALNAAGLNVHAFDLLGHGLSYGRRGHIASWSEYRGDLAAFLKLAREEERAGPGGGGLFLIGHSMGALIVLDFLLNHHDAVDAAVVSGAPIEPAGVANPFLIAVARALSRVWPACPLPLGIRPDYLSRDKAAVRAARRDRLCHYRVTARWATEVLATIDRVKARAAGITTPLLVCHGGDDRLNSPDGSRWLAEHVSSGDRRLIVYDGAYHELQNDLCHAQFAADVAAWLAGRIAQRP